MLKVATERYPYYNRHIYEKHELPQNKTLHPAIVLCVSGNRFSENIESTMYNDLLQCIQLIA